MRFGLRSQIILLSCFLALLPWLGYEYVWEMEKYLRQGQEKTLVGTTRALATALHERPKLFDHQASFLEQVVKGRDLYAYNLPSRIQLDGKLHDWKTYQPLFWHYDKSYLTPINPNHDPADLSFTHMVGKYDKYLYAVFKVKDDNTQYRGTNSLSITNNDYLKIALKKPDNQIINYIIAPKQDGWITAYETTTLAPISKIQGHFLKTTDGYNIEIRMPLNMIGNKLGFAIVDKDDKDTPIKTMSTSNLQDLSQLGSVLVPSPEIERIIKGMGHSGSRIWVVDNHHRVLAQSGKIQDADGVWSQNLTEDSNKLSKWGQFERQYLHPLYYKILTKPPADFLDTLFDVTSLQGENIKHALAGNPQSSWRLTPDKKAVILSAAYPIWIDDKVMGAVIAEETTNGVRTLRNKALEKLFTVILAVMLIGTLSLFFFASRISSRIRTLRDAAEAAIDPQGRILRDIKSSNTQDEIGDLSRSFANIVGRLGGYTHYLENMSSRLSHELRTPVAVVRSSLESLQLQNLDEESQKYIERATDGVHRLNKIITTMSEATRLEQSIQSAEAESFNLTKVVSGCMQGYQMAYPEKSFVLKLSDEKKMMQGVPEFIAQLLDKLIANAVEFSEPDTPISVDYHTDNQTTYISVINKGPLLPPEIGDHIFDSMVSVRSQSLQKKPHLGLGLYIARLVADFHHAQLSATNLNTNDGVEFKLAFKNS